MEYFKKKNYSKLGSYDGVLRRYSKSQDWCFRFELNSLCGLKGYLIHVIANVSLILNFWNFLFVLTKYGLLTKSGPIQESKGMCAIFQLKDKKCKIMLKKGEIFENMGKNWQNLKILWKRAGDCAQLSHAINC